jgi:hypothetical protein
MYIHNTAVIQHQHVDALRLALQAVMDLISTLPEDVLALSSKMTEVSADPQMQEYADDEDLCMMGELISIVTFLFS